MEGEVGSVAMNGYTAPPFFQHQFFPGAQTGKQMVAGQLSLSLDPPDSRWNPPNWERQGAERNEWDVKAWNWDSVMFLAQPSSNKEQHRQNLEEEDVTANKVNASCLKLNSMCESPDAVGNGSSTHDSSSPDQKRDSPYTNGSCPPLTDMTKGLAGDDASSDDAECLTLKLGGHSYFCSDDNESSKNKRHRSSSPGSQYPMCQVDDCRADLSNARDYHRRHKVCEMHSKAAKAPVARIMQRFCQQCSRFHPLQEFDEGKRSCRRRLAGHNRRRRKVQPDSASARAYLLTEDDIAGRSAAILNLVHVLSQLQGTGSHEKVNAANSVLDCLKKAISVSTAIGDLANSKLASTIFTGNQEPTIIPQRADTKVNSTPMNGHAPTLITEAQVLSALASSSDYGALTTLLQNSIKGQVPVVSKPVQEALMSHLLQNTNPLAFASSAIGGYDKQTRPSERTGAYPNSGHNYTHMSMPLPGNGVSPASNNLSAKSANTVQQFLGSTPSYSPAMAVTSNSREQSQPMPAASKLFPLQSAPLRMNGNVEGYNHPLEVERAAFPSLGTTNKRARQDVSPSHFAQSSDLQKIQAQQTSESLSGSDQSPESSYGDVQDRTGRISFKLFDRSPGDFPQVLRAQILEWLSHVPSEMESYIRPGCVILSIFLSMPQSMWEELQRDLPGMLGRLVNTSTGDFWCKGRILVQVEKEIAYICDGEIRGISVPPSYRTPKLLSVRPVAVVAGKETQLIMEGFNFSKSEVRLTCGHQGDHILDDLVEEETISAAPNDEVNEDESLLIEEQCYNFGGGQANTIGRCFIEVEHGNFLPLIVADSAVCEELRTLEIESEKASTIAASIAKTNQLSEDQIVDLANTVQLAADLESRQFLNELGWMFQRSFWQTSGKLTEAIFPSRFSSGTLNHLFTFAIERDWCAIVKNLLDIVLVKEVEHFGAVFSSVKDLHILHKAVSRKCHRVVDMLLSYEPHGLLGHEKEIHRIYLFTPDMSGPGGCTPLHIAAMIQGAEDVLDSLISDPGQVGLSAWNTARDESGQTPLEYALAQGNMAYIQRVWGKLNMSQVAIDIPSLELSGYRSNASHLYSGASSQIKDLCGSKETAPKTGPSVFSTCSKQCDRQYLPRYPRQMGGIRGPAYRPFMLSMVAIAAVCVCVCLLLKGPPMVRFVIPPFTWESVQYGPK